MTFSTSTATEAYAVASLTSIEWTTCTWNPVTGCSKVSAGCANCYAERMAKRLQAMGNKRYVDGFRVRTHADLLTLPFEWQKPRLIFVNSMSDLFHEEVPVDFIQSVFDTITRCGRHTFQILTKRAERLAELAPSLPWPRNLWMGVTVENQSCVRRIDYLRSTDAAVKFVSAEPLLGSLEINLDGLDWLIVGGESGPGARPMEARWVRDLRDTCRAAGVPFFFKQWGGVNKKAAGRLLDGQVWEEMPMSCLGYLPPHSSRFSPATLLSVSTR